MTSEERIPPGEWVNEATYRISRIVLKNGVENVNKTFSANGIPLQNYLGFALGIPFNSIKPDQELSPLQNGQLIKGELSFYKESALERIKAFISPMYANASESSNVHLIIVPIFHYDEKKCSLTPFFLFRYRIGTGSDEFFIDSSGRVYNSFDRFLNRNNIPNGMICYPHKGHFKMGEENLLVCGVFKCGSIISHIDVGIGIFGIISGVGATIATGGIFLPIFVGASIGSAVYGTGRGISKLVDRGQHNQSINPFTNREARVVWLSMAANVVSFSAMGVRYALVSRATASGSTVADTKSGALVTGVNILQVTSSLLNGVAGIDQITYLVKRWSTLPTSEKIMIMASICFHFRCSISYQNADKIMETAKNNWITAVLGPNLMTNRSVESALSCFFSNPIGLKLAVEVFERNIQVETDLENYTIKFFGKFSFTFRNILGFEGKDITNLFNMLSSIVGAACSTFILLKQFYSNDVQIVRLIASEKQENGNSWEKTLQVLQSVTDLFKSLSNINVALQNCRIRIGRGVFLTLSEAFNVRSICGWKGARQFFGILIDLPVDSCQIFNRILEHTHIKDLAKCIKALNEHDMKEAFQGLIHGKKNCGLFDKVRFIEYLENGLVLIESRCEIELAVFKKFDSTKLQNFVNSSFVTTVTRLGPENREIIKKIWMDSFLEKNDFFPLIFQKVDHLMQVFGEKDEEITKNSIKFALVAMKAKTISEFYYFVLFALIQVELRTNFGVSIEEVNFEVFSNMEVLSECYKSMEKKVLNMKLNDFSKIDSGLDEKMVSEILKQHGTRGDLKFGPLGNAVFHAAQQPELIQRDGLKTINQYFSQMQDNGQFTPSNGIKTVIVKDQNDVQFILVISESGQVYIDAVHPIIDDLIFNF